MAEGRFPLDPTNPGEVFACLGFLEAAEVLWPGSSGGFVWSADSVDFVLCAPGEQPPVEGVLRFLVEAEMRRCAPRAYTEPAPQGRGRRRRTAAGPREEGGGDLPLERVETFPAPEAKVDGKTLPVLLQRGDCRLGLSCWCDASSREPFKLFAGQQRAPTIASEMRALVRDLWQREREALTERPFATRVAMGGGSFKLDARKSWTAADAGYSPDEQGYAVAASPVVELLGAAGLEHARPQAVGQRAALQFRYGVWRGTVLPPLARAALAAVPAAGPLRLYRFGLQRAGQNKVVTFAQEEIGS